MIPTPDLSHLAAKDYEHVYEPAEDTFLLLDALEEDEKELKEFYPSVSLEIGSAASGNILKTSLKGVALQFRIRLRIRIHWENTWAFLYLCSDINPYACTCTRATGTQNKVVLDAINASFASPLITRLQRSVDIILFNPPYVPTIPEEMNDAQDHCDISGSWAGGTNGMNVTDIFLEHVEKLMSERGRFYLVAVAENNVPGIRERMLRLYGLRSDIVLSRRAGREHLFVIRFLRKTQRMNINNTAPQE